MKKYFYSDGKSKHGPFTLEELREENIERTTKVWYHELEDWKEAGSIPELEDILMLTPPPVNIENDNDKGDENIFTHQNRQEPPKTWLLESILVTLFCCLPFGIAGIVNASKVETRFYAGDLEGAERYSKEAQKWTQVSFIVGLVVSALYFFIIIGSEL